MVFKVTLVFKKDGKNNHIRKRYIVYSENEQSAIEKVKRTLRCKKNILIKGEVFRLEKEKVCVYNIEEETVA